MLNNSTPKYSVTIKTGPEGFIIVRDSISNKVLIEHRNDGASTQVDGTKGAPATSIIDLSKVTDQELIAELQRRLNGNK